MRTTLGRRGVAVAALTMMTVVGSVAVAVVPASALPSTTVPPTTLPPTTRPPQPAPQPTVAAAPQAVAAPQAPATFQLPAPAAVGQHATLSVALDAEAAGPPASGALSVRVSMSRSVTGVDGSGGFDVRSTITGVEVAQAPSGFNSSELDGLSGVSLAQSFTSAGAALGAPLPAGGGGQTGGRQLLDWIGATSIGFPAEPIAIGASWSSPGRAGSVGGIVVPVSFQCRLASVDGGQYVVEVSYASDFTGVEAAIGVVSGTVAGWGTVTGSLDNPMVVGGSVNQSIDGQVTVGTMTTPLAITSTLTVRPRGG